MISAVKMASAELEASRHVPERELVAHVLLLCPGNCRADIGLLVNVVRTEIDRTRLRERQVQLELAGTEGQRVLRQFHQPSDVDELQVAVAQSAPAVIPGDAKIIVHPECDVASKISRGEDAEEPGFKIGCWNQPRDCAR